MEEKRNLYRSLVGESPLGRSRRKCEDNIKIDLKEVGWGYRVDRSGLE
jgi:hypothetical protein